MEPGLLDSKLISLTLMVGNFYSVILTPCNGKGFGCVDRLV